ncbi:hypothetical protein GCM10023340_00580 [Nocardioides marinquilinus]|uniref:Uncharacterized protein n=1 Tax=Nocardioides marinquilinus TaxID=1210400 RepID=A0ABP9PAA8_9ACTN
MRRRHRETIVLSLTLAALVGGLVGCDEQAAEPPPPPPSPTATPEAGAEREPAAQAMERTPASATELTVTDYTELRLQLGFGELTSASPAADRAGFWRQADAEAPLLSEGLLRGPDTAGLLEEHGFGEDDVAWEARFSGPDGEGWVVAFRDDLPMDGVVSAVGLGEGPLDGATVWREAHLVTSEDREPGEDSWAMDPELLSLVGIGAGATYVSRECVPGDPVDGLDELGPFSITFGATLATARLGPLRDDAFERADLAGPAFTDAFASPVADPHSGRLGWTLADAPAAAALTLAGDLPFAVCAG